MSPQNHGLSLVVNRGSDPFSEIDRLYQLPLAEFTAARNALAKRLGKTDPPIRDLQKPSVPAWAVNQLYWRERPTYDRLIESAERLRGEHRNLLAGKSSNIRDAEKSHRDAIRSASEKVKAILTENREAATPATLTAVAETLEALPSADTPGRLTRPLKPGGFEALTGVPARPSPSPKVPQRKSPDKAAVAGATDPATLRREAAAKEREAEAARREAAKENERLMAEAHRAKTALEKARAAVTKAEEDVERREKALADARKTRDRLRDDAALSLSEYQRATRRARE